MNYLLDTAAYLWFVTGNTKLSDNARECLEDSSSEVYLSLASIWELAIKSSLDRGLDLPRPFHQFVDEELKADRFQVLNISVAHLKLVASLPHIHRDPFDRLLIAQSLVEALPIITSDRAFDSYDVQRVW